MLSALGVLAAGVGAVVLGPAPIAGAVPAGVVVTCASAQAHLGCTVTWRSADGQVSIRWAVNGRHLATADDQTSFRLACTPGTGYSVSVVVADATGRTQAADRVLCQRA
ncbi:MAG TPA: hypothetical protein VGD67_01965 [Pseudonocardiaceae bacterium]